MKISVKSFTGPDAKRFTPDLARLRIKVFREFPYLYDGSLANEEKYLKTFLQALDSIIVIAFDGDRVIGASTGMPLEQETSNIQKPWLEHGHDLKNIFYFSESILLSEYRGQGVGVRFFEEREKWARELGRFDALTFCAVVRPADHPFRPKTYTPLDLFWEKRGFRKKDGYVCHISWKDISEEEESQKPLQFWEKPI